MAQRTTNSAERTRRYRERHREGRKVIPQELSAEALERLVADGWLDEDDMHDRRRIREAIARFWDDYADHVL